MTSVGGTSFESFNPDANGNPSYPAGVETVWNTDNLCNASANEGGLPGFDWCAFLAAGGGGNSITGKGQAVNNNGAFLTTPGFDLSTGIGTPKMGALITLIPQL